MREGIETALRSRNAGLPDGDRVEFRQMFHMVHRDGAQMLTIGGAVVGNADEGRWEECGIEDLEFTRAGEASCEVKIPTLTRREMQHLLGRMPDAEGTFEETAVRIGIPKEHAKQFASSYRYAPLFVEAEDW